MVQKKRHALEWFICGCAAMAIAPAPLAAQATETVLHRFRNNMPQGGTPAFVLIRDAAGSLYSTAGNGGRNGQGVVFRVDSTGQETVLYTFTGGADGGSPRGGVIEDSTGNLYGTTAAGGSANAGVLYKLDSTGHETVLYSFTGGADGKAPVGSVVRDATGNLYGTTHLGGPANAGVVYKVDTTGHETVLYAFTGGADGGSPNAGVILDSAGNLYGTAGTVVFQVDPGGHETVLYTFPASLIYLTGVIRDSAGNLYGTTSNGGSSGAGSMYKVDTMGHETVLYNFAGGADGFGPSGDLILDGAGNLYGTTGSGGASGDGVVYRLDATGHETVLYSFTGFMSGSTDGADPAAGVISDASGNLYGTTALGGGGGPSGPGTVYELDTTGQETVLYRFPRGIDGNSPSAGLAGDAAGNLYGTTTYGGPENRGVVYKLDAAGRETVLHAFTGGADGGTPSSGVIVDSAGNVYGTTSNGGSLGWGVVYKLDAAGSETVLYSFTGRADGGEPIGGVVRDQAGNLIGTTFHGGNKIGDSGSGVVYKIGPSGGETVLYRFGANEGGATGVILDLKGNLYGTTQIGGAFEHGAVYKLDATGHETVLYSFTGGADGANPDVVVIRDAAGNLYGTTSQGGVPANMGVVYKLDPAGNETVLHSFTGADGANPDAGVIRDAAGNFYGTTPTGGSGGGVVYKLDTEGNETVLYSFTGVGDGYRPEGGVIRDSAGNLYGTTYDTGVLTGTGTVFKIKP